MSGVIKTYRDLLVWDKAVDLAVAVYRFSEDYRKPAYFAMMDQLIRAAGSVPANIAEGYGRRSRGDYLRFVGYSNGSLSELETHLHVARRYKSEWRSELDPMLLASAEVGRMLVGLHRAVAKGPPKPG
jgi:four helix bundle protein